MKKVLFNDGKKFTETYGPKMDGEKRRRPSSSPWSRVPTKTLFARYQLAQALADAGADDLAVDLLSPGSEETIARMAEVLKRSS